MNILIADGSKYIGEWDQGKQHGQGCIVDQNEMEKKGVWQEGKLVRWLDESS